MPSSPNISDVNNYLLALQNSICADLEKVDGGVVFIDVRLNGLRHAYYVGRFSIQVPLSSWIVRWSRDDGGRRTVNFLRSLSTPTKSVSCAEALVKEHDEGSLHYLRSQIVLLRVLGLALEGSWSGQVVTDRLRYAPPQAGLHYASGRKDCLRIQPSS